MRDQLSTSKYDSCVPAVKVIRATGTSEDSQEDAAHETFFKDSEIVEYKATIEIAFPIEH